MVFCYEQGKAEIITNCIPRLGSSSQVSVVGLDATEISCGAVPLRLDAKSFIQYLRKPAAYYVKQTNSQIRLDLNRYGLGSGFSS
jgi:hypothetical protein